MIEFCVNRNTLVDQVRDAVRLLDVRKAYVVTIKLLSEAAGRGDRRGGEMRKSNGELWEKATAGLWVDAPMDALRDAFACAVRVDEADHVRQECAEAAEACHRNDGDMYDMKQAILNAGKAPALKPGMLVEWRGSITKTRYIQEWSPDDAVRFGAGERKTLRVIPRDEIQAWLDKTPE